MHGVVLRNPGSGNSQPLGLHDPQSCAAGRIRKSERGHPPSQSPDTYNTRRHGRIAMAPGFAPRCLGQRWSETCPQSLQPPAVTQFQVSVSRRDGFDPAQAISNSSNANISLTLSGSPLGNRRLSANCATSRPGPCSASTALPSHTGPKPPVGLGRCVCWNLHVRLPGIALRHHRCVMVADHFQNHRGSLRPQLRFQRLDKGQHPADLFDRTPRAHGDAGPRPISHPRLVRHVVCGILENHKAPLVAETQGVPSRPDRGEPENAPGRMTGQFPRWRRSGTANVAAVPVGGLVLHKGARGNGRSPAPARLSSRQVPAVIRCERGVGFPVPQGAEPRDVLRERGRAAATCAAPTGYCRTAPLCAIPRR